MKENSYKKINFKKRKENLKSSLGDIEKFLNRLNKSIKYLSIYKKIR